MMSRPASSSARGPRARWRRPALRSEKILQPAKARARARAAGTARPASCGRSAIRAAGSCRPAWWERASLSVDEFGGNFPEPGGIDTTAALDIAPGEVARGEPHVLREAIVPVAARIRRRDQLLDNRPARRLVAFQRTFYPIFPVQGFDEGDRILHCQARSRPYREVRGAQGIADQHHVAGMPAGISHVRKVPPYGLVRDETVPSQGSRERPFTVLKRRRLALENEGAQVPRVPVVVSIESPVLVLDEGLRQRAKDLRGAEPGEPVGERRDAGAEVGRPAHERIGTVRRHHQVVSPELLI